LDAAAGDDSGGGGRSETEIAVASAGDALPIRGASKASPASRMRMSPGHRLTLAAWIQLLGWPGALVFTGFVLSAVISMTAATPLLGSFDPSTKDRIFHNSTSHPELDLERVRVEPGPQPACIQLRSRGGMVTGPICNRHLLCDDSSAPPSPYWSYEVFRLHAPDAFYVETGSACYSGCCDWSGMSFNGDGKRLDDGILQRVYLRLGIPGSAAALLGLFSVVWAWRTGRRWSRIMVVAGFGIAIGMLWWNR
jgi:hypothetical protein